MPLADVPLLHGWEDDRRHWLLMRHSLSDPAEKAYYCVFAPKATTLHEMVKAIGARWHLEEDFETTKAMGLDQYEVRNWTAWYRHVTLVMLAYAFLVGMCAQVRTSPYESAPQAPRPLLPPTVPEVRHLAPRFEYEAGAGLVLVATMPPKRCQLLPHQTPS